MTNLVQFIYMGPTENEPEQINFGQGSIPALGGPLCMNISGFLQDGIAHGTLHGPYEDIANVGVGFGEWDIVLTVSDKNINLAWEDFLVVRQKFRKAWDARLWYVKVYPE